MQKVPNTPPVSIPPKNSLLSRTIDWLGVILVLIAIGSLLVFLGSKIYCVVTSQPVEACPGQLMYVFISGISFCSGLILLHARGHLPQLEMILLRQLVDATFGQIPKLLDRATTSRLGSSDHTYSPVPVRVHHRTRRRPPTSTS
jgi:hypothetical protein